jgi:hypothetical protein
MPEHHAGRDVVDVEQVQLAPSLRWSRFSASSSIVRYCCSSSLVGPGRAVDALQHLVAVVAAPVGAGHLHQLEVPQLAGAGHVRAAAQVLEAAFGVQRHVLAGRDAADDLGLVVLADALEVRHGLVARQHAPRDRFVLGGQLRHALLDGHQVLGREGALVREVVEEAVLDHRADGHLRLGNSSLTA